MLLFEHYLSEKHVQHLQREVLGLNSLLLSNEPGVVMRSVHTNTFLRHLSKTSSEYFAIRERESDTGDLFMQLGERFLSSGQNGVCIYTYTSEDACCIQILQKPEVLDDSSNPYLLSISEFQAYQGNAVMFSHDIYNKSPFLQAVVPDEKIYSGQWRNRGYWIPERVERLTDDQKIMMGAQLFHVASRCGGLRIGSNNLLNETQQPVKEDLKVTSIIIDTNELANDLSSHIGDTIGLRIIGPDDRLDINTQYCVESDGIRRFGRVIWDGDIAIVLNYKNREILRVHKDKLQIIGRFAMKISTID